MDDYEMHPGLVKPALRLLKTQLGFKGCPIVCEGGKTKVGGWLDQKASVDLLLTGCTAKKLPVGLENVMLQWKYASYNNWCEQGMDNIAFSINMLGRQCKADLGLWIYANSANTKIAGWIIIDWRALVDLQVMQEDIRRIPKRTNYIGTAPCPNQRVRIGKPIKKFHFLELPHLLDLWNLPFWSTITAYDLRNFRHTLALKFHPLLVK